MSDIEDEGGDPACWLHLFEEEEEEVGETESGVDAGDGDPGGDIPTWRAPGAGRRCLEEGRRAASPLKRKGPR